MIDELTLRQMNGEYPMPEDAGPAWRKLREMGEDLTLLEDSLAMPPQERIRVHALLREQMMAIYASNPSHCAE